MAATVLEHEFDFPMILRKFRSIENFITIHSLGATRKERKLNGNEQPWRWKK